MQSFDEGCPTMAWGVTAAYGNMIICKWPEATLEIHMPE